MTKRRLWMPRSLILACVLALLLLTSTTAQTMPALPEGHRDDVSNVKGPAASSLTITLNASQDTYTDINLATTNLNEGLLNAANSAGFLEEPNVTTKKVFLAFDLSGVDFEIRSATLTLSTLTCGGLVPVDVAAITVYGVDNGLAWAEDTLTWATQPELSTGALASLEAGATIFDMAQTCAWTDRNRGDLATWLESQRGANDGQATLVLVIDNAAGPGVTDVFFEDHEGTGAMYGCADSLGGPTLEVSYSIGDYRIYLPLIKH